MMRLLALLLLLCHGCLSKYYRNDLAIVESTRKSLEIGTDTLNRISKSSAQSKAVDFAKKFANSNLGRACQAFKSLEVVSIFTSLIFGDVDDQR